MGRRFGFIGNVTFINNKKYEKAKNDSDGNGVKSGDILLENNGGLSSVRYQLCTKTIQKQFKP